VAFLVAFEAASFFDALLSLGRAGWGVIGSHVNFHGVRVFWRDSILSLTAVLAVRQVSEVIVVQGDQVGVLVELVWDLDAYHSASQFL
jgi:hypothetical protein